MTLNSKEKDELAQLYLSLSGDLREVMAEVAARAMSLLAKREPSEQREEEGRALGTVIGASDMGLRKEAAVWLSHRLVEQSARIAALEAERDAALADLASMLAAFEKGDRFAGDLLWSMRRDPDHHPGAVLLERLKTAEANDMALKEALGDISTRCEAKELRHYSPDDANLAIKQRRVIDGIWAVARAAYTAESPGPALMERLRKAEERMKSLEALAANVGEDGWPKDVLTVDWETWRRMSPGQRADVNSDAKRQAKAVGRPVRIFLVEQVGVEGDH